MFLKLRNIDQYIIYSSFVERSYMRTMFNNVVRKQLQSFYDLRPMISDYNNRVHDFVGIVEKAAIYLKNLTNNIKYMLPEFSHIIDVKECF